MVSTLTRDCAWRSLSLMRAASPSSVPKAQRSRRCDCLAPRDTFGRNLTIAVNRRQSFVPPFYTCDLKNRVIACFGKIFLEWQYFPDSVQQSGWSTANRSYQHFSAFCHPGNDWHLSLTDHTRSPP